MKNILYFDKFIKMFESSVNAEGNLVGFESNLFDEFPEDFLKTLEKNYFYIYKNKFDWNSKMDKFRTSDGKYDNRAFHKWMNKNTQFDFVKNLNKIISVIREDLILIKRKQMATRKLELFEELIKPVNYRKNKKQDL